MDLSEYRQELMDRVQARASAGENFAYAEFVAICGEQLSDLGEHPKPASRDHLKTGQP